MRKLWLCKAEYCGTTVTTEATTMPGVSALSCPVCQCPMYPLSVQLQTLNNRMARLEGFSEGSDERMQKLEQHNEEVMRQLDALAGTDS